MILGSLTLMVVLHGLVTSWSGPRRLLAFHLSALVFIILAMQQTHDSILGRMALACGLAAEVAAWFASRSHRDGTRVGAGPESMLTETGTAGTGEQTIESIGEPDLESVSGHPSKAGDAESCRGNDAEEGIEVTPDPMPSESSDHDTEVSTREASPTVDSPVGASAENGGPEPAPDPPLSDSDEPPEAAQPKAVEHGFTTYVLLDRPYTLSGEVFLASLRRSGQRDAALAVPSEAGGTIRIQAGPIRLELCSFDEPWQPADESFMQADTDAPLRTHAAYASIVSVFEISGSRDDVIRLHHRAHAALAEFAPALAAAWPATGLVVPAPELESLRSRAGDTSAAMAKTCTRLRSFELDGPAAGMVLWDTLGLSALGLPDIQLVVEKGSDDAIQLVIRDLVDRFLESGCDLENGSEIMLGGDQTWRVTHTRAAFSPDREVIQIVAKP